MDIDPKCFFEQAPRMQDSVKQFFKKLAYDTISSFILIARTLGIEKITEANVKLLVFQTTNDTIVTYSSKHGLLVQLNKVRPISKIICRSINELDIKDKYSNLDKKIVKGVASALQEFDIKATHGGKLALSVVVSETCGVVIQSAAQTLSEKTLTLECIDKNAFLYKSSKDGVCINDSLFRFVSYILPDHNFPIPQIAKQESSSSTNENQPSSSFDQFRKPKKIKDVENAFQSIKTKLPISILKKEVKFYPHTITNQRPNTPDICFWEDEN